MTNSTPARGQARADGDPSQEASKIRQLLYARAVGGGVGVVGVGVVGVVVVVERVERVERVARSTSA
jgi:hypothetical protein